MDNFIKIDIDVLKRHSFTAIEYITLHYIYCIKSEIEDPYQGQFGIVSKTIMESLQIKQFIKILPDNKVELREKTREVFESKKDLFITWLTTFPIKTPSGRYLSPVDPDTVIGKSCRKKWNKHFKSDVNAQLNAIAVLQAEIQWRNQNMKQEFMHNAETWLNQGDWQKFNYLLNDKESSIKRNMEDYK